jgi:hypothetical protein
MIMLYYIVPLRLHFSTHQWGHHLKMLVHKQLISQRDINCLYTGIFRFGYAGLMMTPLMGSKHVAEIVLYSITSS